ncbi:MAG TPA: 23S rRNA (uracil(1939)-C(5))-methyltransferase RlmD [Steroidobacteraceae bacterium]|nr:23S rRNA (uracil(1939)-C(5))-methyltransferase RlmD [Steroidobacteraceae bacterium]
MSDAEQGAVDALTHEGEGVVHAGKTAFVAGALPGELVRFRRVRRRKHHDEAALLEIVRPAPERTLPRCAHFGVCGGCALQHLDPARQIAAKQTELRDGLERLARTAPERWLEPLTGPEWGYRRRARLGVRYVPKKGRVLVGFRERLSPYVTATERCEVLAPPVGELIAPLSELLSGLEIGRRVPQIEVAIGDNATALVLRVLGEAPTPEELERLRAFELARAVRLYLQPGGIDSVTRLSEGSEAPLRYALPEFDLQIEFAPTDFIQINAPVNRALVAQAVGLLELARESRVLDLYCGLGNFTLPLARRAGGAVGVEGEHSLVERARHNARSNGIENVEFVATDLSSGAAEGAPWLREPFSHVLLDPPRVGARDVMRTIARIDPQRVLYISCHPGSLARDVGTLVHEHGFVLRAAGVVDMFPHTTHVESLALLTPGA